MKKGRLFLLLLTVILSVLFLVNQNLVEASRPVPGKDPVKNYLSQCDLKKPVIHRNLTIIPVIGPKTSLSVLTLDEALESKLLTIKEVSQQGTVNTLAVYNESKSHVFIMAGEILAGAKQDRVLKEDALIPPNSGKVLVNAYCVEQGRWAHKSDKFYSENKAANISVRQSARDMGTQGAVWGKVAETNRAVAADAPTQSLSSSFESEKVQKEKKEYSRHFIDIPGQYPGANGVIVLVNGKVLVADMFSSDDIFKKLWPKLYESYILEAISRQKSSVDSDFVKSQDFIAEIIETQIKYHDGAGTGRNFDFRNNRVLGSGIILRNNMIHMEAFPRVKSAPPENQTRPGIQRDYQGPATDQLQITPAPGIHQNNN